VADLRAYDEENFPHQSESDRERDVANELSLRSITGGLDLQEIIKSEPTKLSVLL
jgi:hypothetical protein